METPSERHEPGHELFGTPENSAFQAAKPYQPLDRSERVIRLLKLSLNYDHDGADIVCELIQNIPVMDGSYSYTALSYCAGDPRKTRVIYVNGLKCKVFANLRHALGQMRIFGKSIQEKDYMYIWADQVCINQMDLRERSHQVGFMREIYSRAARTLVCLSDKEGDARGMEWLVEMTGTLRETGASLSPDETTIAWRKVLIDAEHRTPDGRLRFLQGWLAAYEVLSSSWWSRVWILQELFVSRNVFFGFRSVFIQLEGHASYLTVIATMDRLLDSYSHPRPPPERLSNILICDTFDDLNKWTLSRYRWKYKESIMIHMIQDQECRGSVQAALSLLQIKSEGVGHMEWAAALRHSLICKSSDVRDKIYALLGLVDPAYAIEADYTQSMSEVLTNAAVKTVEFEGRFGTLRIIAAHLTLDMHGIPSWLAIWRDSVMGFSEKRAIDNGDAPAPAASDSQEPTVQSVIYPPQSGRQVYALCAHGECLDTLLNRTESTNWGFRDHPGRSGVDWIGVRTDIGDEVWHIVGSPELLILRRIRSAPACYSAICTTSLSLTGTIKDSVRNMIHEAGKGTRNSSTILII